MNIPGARSAHNYALDSPGEAHGTLCCPRARECLGRGKPAGVLSLLLELWDRRCCSLPNRCAVGPRETLEGQGRWL